MNHYQQKFAIIGHEATHQPSSTNIRHYSPVSSLDFDWKTGARGCVGQLLAAGRLCGVLLLRGLVNGWSCSVASMTMIVHLDGLWWLLMMVNMKHYEALDSINLAAIHWGLDPERCHLLTSLQASLAHTHYCCWLIIVNLHVLLL